ncbi:helix-turn-helix domain-containing protein [Mucilaginibacter kameinonensis]|uniref:helix-turn-helix domain-containing protein n=1 Tax=Mucilaginibacter kameinonensis TaxID=452286 RepID=UPI000EF814D2|nr:helix-turn-helix transcriptional regulator [Mucilaginibacter kameinonensis]
MSTTSEKPTQIHHGRNIKRFREMLGIKQEPLALELGDDWSQRRVSLLEAKDAIEDDILVQIATILKVPVEAIKNFDEEKAINNIQNNYDNSVIHAGPAINFQCTFNPIDKWLEVIEENKKLYERLLQSEREKVEILKNKS